MVDSSNNAYIVGQTWSQSFPVTGDAFQPLLNGACDAFVAELDSTGSALSPSTYLGGADYDVATAVTMDSTGSLYVTGYTYSTDFPVTSSSKFAGSSDVFAAKIVSGTPPLPNLNVSALTVPVKGAVGQKISVANTVRNVGTGVPRRQVSASTFPLHRPPRHGWTAGIISWGAAVSRASN